MINGETRRILAGFAVAMLVARLAVLHAADAKPTAKPNILWLVGENLSHDLGCYGAKQVHTPNLDRLAAQGVRYTRVFATNPACAPSRSAFFTGMYQTTTDTHPMRSHRDDDFRLPPGVQPITHRLQSAGYFTANIKTVGDQGVGTGKLDLNFVNEGPIYHENSCDWSRLKSRQPFFAVVNAEESEYDIYDHQSAKKTRVEWVGERTHAQHANATTVTPPPYYPEHRVVREEWRALSEFRLRHGPALSAKYSPNFAPMFLRMTRSSFSSATMAVWSREGFTGATTAACAYPSSLNGPKTIPGRHSLSPGRWTNAFSA